MTPSARAVREGIVLPLLFLSVALAGGLRVAPDGMQFLFPRLPALVLALLLLAVLWQSGMLVSGSLLHERRTPLENLSGFVVLAALFGASAQMFNLLTPENGLFAFVANVLFFGLLLNTVAARPDRPRVLRSLLVTFGAAFLLKYVVLGAFADPDPGLARRALGALLSELAPGSVQFPLPTPATGYVAFFTTLAYFVGLTLLPHWTAVDGLLPTQHARRADLPFREDGGSTRT
ncbi:MAG: hypothetical protein EHM13_11805 [Acidobacteria bacterium]|nr:MAG: hypothetical protein EHM13_11805 [Acidobacteriota bacterium]